MQDFDNEIQGVFKEYSRTKIKIFKELKLIIVCVRPSAEASKKEREGKKTIASREEETDSEGR